MHNCPQFKAHHAEIVLGTTGPILVYQIASNDTRILVDIQGKMPSDPKEYMMEKVLPQLPGVCNLEDTYQQA
jgi:squalene monooxygenase